VIEQYTKNTRFCLICNYVSKILPALQSRCTRYGTIVRGFRLLLAEYLLDGSFRFAPLQLSELQEQVARVVKAEG
jgi:replication factor C subunit 3/5